MGKESVWGTAVAPTVFLSTDKPAFDEKITPVLDQGLRGIRAKTHALSPAQGMTDVDVPDMPFYGDDSGNLLMALMGVDTFSGGTQKTGTIAASAKGATSLTYTIVGGTTAPVIGDTFKIIDAVNGNELVTLTGVTGAGPYSLTVAATKYLHPAATVADSLFSHVFTLLNTAAPPSYTFTKYDALVSTMRQFPGCYLTSLNPKFSNPGSLTCDAKGLGLLGSETTNGTASYSAEPFYVPWQTSFMLAGVANARIIDFDFTITGDSSQVFGMNGTQNPTAAVAGMFSVTGTYTVVPDDYTEFNYYLQNTQPPVIATVDNGSTRFIMQMSECAFEDPVTFDHSGDYTQLSVAFEAIANATDGGTGLSPFKATLLNQKASAY
jgi:hypothetical protein